MDIKIQQFSNEFLDEMAQLFADEYSEPDREWDLKTSKEYLMRDIDSSPQYCLMAVDEKDSCLGSIFCRLDPYYKGRMLFIDSLQVKPEYRRKGIAKRLLVEVLRKAKKDGIGGAHLLADARAGFPRSWYEELGFELSGWAEYEVDWNNLKFY